MRDELSEAQIEAKKLACLAGLVVVYIFIWLRR
jgi:hypothetical protein